MSMLKIKIKCLHSWETHAAPPSRTRLPFLGAKATLTHWVCAFASLAVLGLSCGMWDLVPWPGIEPGPPALTAQSLSHRTTREVPWCVFLWNPEGMHPCHVWCSLFWQDIKLLKRCFSGAFLSYLRGRLPGCSPRVRACMLNRFSHVWHFVTLWTVAHQAPLSVGFSRQEYWSGLLCPPPGDLPDSGVETKSLLSPALASRFFTTSATWEAHSLQFGSNKTLSFCSYSRLLFIFTESWSGDICRDPNEAGSREPLGSDESSLPDYLRLTLREICNSLPWVTALQDAAASPQCSAHLPFASRSITGLKARQAPKGEVKVWPMTRCTLPKGPHTFSKYRIWDCVWEWILEYGIMGGTSWIKPNLSIGWIKRNLSICAC